MFLYCNTFGLGLLICYQHCLPYPQVLAACPPGQHARLTHDFQLIHQTVAAGIHASKRTANETTWGIWEDFCVCLHIDPELIIVTDPRPLLQLFALRYRTRALAPSGSPVHSQTVEGVLRAVVQAFSALGCPNPRLTPNGKFDFRLSCQLTAYTKPDPPPQPVKPIPLAVIGYTADFCCLANTAYATALADMLLLGFIFC